MSLYPFPNTIPVKSRGVSLVPNTGAFPASPLSGAIQTRDRGGEHLRLSLTLENLTVDQSRALAGFLATINGQQHRVSIRDPAYLGPRGSLTVSEIVDVDFNATNWEIQPTAEYGKIEDISGGVRYTQGRTHNPSPVRPTDLGDGISAPTVGHTYALVQQAWNHRAGPHADVVPRSSLLWRDASWGDALGQSAVSIVPARQVIARTCPDVTTFFARPHVGHTGNVTGATVDLGVLSAARCLLVDNAENLITYSEQFDHANWTTVGIDSVDPDSTTDPEGNSQADTVIEDTSTGTHRIQQNYTRVDQADWFTITVWARANGDRDLYMRVDDGGSNLGAAIFDLTAGTFSGVTNGGTAQFTIATMDAAEIGDSPDWFRCRITTYLPAGTTTARPIFYIYNGTTSYTGDGSGSIRLFGAQFTNGHQQGRYALTTDSAALADSQTGSEIWLKGLDTNTPAQLLAGDQIEIGGHLYVLAADLDGLPSGGFGLARVWPRIRTAPANETAVIIHQPHGTFIIDEPDSAIESTPGIWSAYALDLIQDIVA